MTVVKMDDMRIVKEVTYSDPEAPGRGILAVNLVLL
jgi:hypothetical protein